MCKQIFAKAITEDEAVQELQSYWPGATPEECAVVCDDCFQKIKPENHPREYRESRRFYQRRRYWEEHAHTPREDIGQEPVVINADTLKIILGINAAIQGRDAKLMLNDKQVLAIALDGTCWLDDKEVTGFKLTNDQLIDLGERALEYSVKHEAKRGLS